MRQSLSHMKSSGHILLFHYRRFLNAWIRPKGVLYSVLSMIGIDAYRRFEAVESEIVGNSLLDVGAGGSSFFSLKRANCIALELRRVPGVDVVASATHLPFRADSFDSTVCVDTMEHIPRPRRGSAIDEMKRVTRQRVILHTPLDDGSTYRGRSCDIALLDWYRKTRALSDRSIEEHVANIEPTPPELESQGFRLRGTHNAQLWLNYSKLYLGYRWPVGLLLSQLYYMLNKKHDGAAPFWGAIGVFKKT